MKSTNDSNADQFKTLVIATPDMAGRLVGRRVPYAIHDKEKLRASACSSIIAWDIEQLPIDGVPLAGFHTGWQDMEIVADSSSVRPLGWLTKTAIVIGDIYDLGGNALSSAPRTLLREQIKLLEDAGFTATVATELEFYLLPLDDGATVSSRRHDYAIDAVTNGMEPFFDELREALAESNITVESWQSEWGLGQWEVNLERGNPLEVADNHIIFKLAVKELALKYGYKATFMAKPSTDQVGSSGHIHISLHNAKDDAVFFDDKNPRNISRPALQAVEGLLRYTKDCMPLYAGNINSYRRLAANEFCGSNPSWGFDNRTATCRVIGDSKESLHLEFRLPGADTNPYLALAGVLAAVRSGMAEKLASRPEDTGDATADAADQYPLSLEAATDAFLQSAYSKKVLGEDFVSLYGAHLLHECRQFSGAVTDWERERYGESV